MDKSYGTLEYFGDFVRPIFLFEPKCSWAIPYLMMIVQGDG